MRSLLLIPLVVVLGTSLCLADEIVLKNGTTIYGTVEKQGEDIVVRDFAGQAVVLRDEVKEIRTVEQLRKSYGFILQREGDAPNHLTLGLWCWKRGLLEEARTHFGEVVKKDPQNRFARWGLGQIKYKGLWLDKGVWTLLPGEEKETWVRFMPKGIKGKINVHVGPRPSAARQLVRTTVFGKTRDIREDAKAKLAALPRNKQREGMLLSLAASSSRVRLRAVEGLSGHKGGDVAKALAKRALIDSVKKVRKASAKALADGSFPEAPELLIGGLRSKHFSVRLNAIGALTLFDNGDTVRALAEVVGSKNTCIPRVNVFFGKQSAFVSDFDVEVASMAAIGDPIIRNQCEGVVLDVKILSVQMRIIRSQRFAAHRALCTIAGQDLGPDAEVWLRWADEKYGKS
jgi:hypothetical protein